MTIAEATRIVAVQFERARSKRRAGKVGQFHVSAMTRVGTELSRQRLADMASALAAVASRGRCEAPPVPPGVEAVCIGPIRGIRQYNLGLDVYGERFDWRFDTVVTR